MFPRRLPEFSMFLVFMLLIPRTVHSALEWTSSNSELIQWKGRVHYNQTAMYHYKGNDLVVHLPGPENRFTIQRALGCADPLQSLAQKLGQIANLIDMTGC